MLISWASLVARRFETDSLESMAMCSGLCLGMTLSFETAQRPTLRSDTLASDGCFGTEPEGYKLLNNAAEALA